MKDSPIGKAIKYTYGRFDKLSRYHLDGRYRPDNNEIENKVRPVACGRRNYLFCGNNDAAEDAAVLYSFFGCCKAAGADFRTWLISSLNIYMIMTMTTRWIWPNCYLTICYPRARYYPLRHRNLPRKTPDTFVNLA